MTKAKTFYVCSTLAQDMAFTLFDTSKAKNGGPNVAIPGSRVLIKGGANVVDFKTGSAPLGVITEVNQEQMNSLNENPHFLDAMEKGYLSVSDKKLDPEVQIAKNDMETRDASSQRVPQDFPEDQAPTAGDAPKKKK